MAHLDSHAVEITKEQFTVPGKAKMLALGTLIIGAVLTIIGVFTLPADNHDKHASNGGVVKVATVANPQDT